MKRALEEHTSPIANPTKKPKNSIIEYRFGHKILSLTFEESLHVKQYSLPILFRSWHAFKKVTFDFSWLQSAVYCNNAEIAKWLAREYNAKPGRLREEHYKHFWNATSTPMVYLQWSRMFDWLNADQTIMRITEMASIVDTSPLYHPNIFYKHVLIYALGYYPVGYHAGNILTLERAQWLIKWVREQTRDAYESIWASVDLYYYPIHSNKHTTISQNICELINNGLLPIKTQNLLTYSSNILLEHAVNDQEYNITSEMFTTAFCNFDIFVTDHAHCENVADRVIIRLALLRELRESRDIKLGDGIASIYLESLLKVCRGYGVNGFMAGDKEAYYTVINIFDWFEKRGAAITQAQLSLALESLYRTPMTEFGFYIISYFLNEGFCIHPYLTQGNFIKPLMDLRNGLVDPEYLVKSFLSNHNQGLIDQLDFNPYATELYFKNFAAKDIARILDCQADNRTNLQAALSLCCRNLNNFNMQKLLLYMHPKIYPHMPEAWIADVHNQFFKTIGLFKEAPEAHGIYIPREIWTKISSYLTIADIKVAKDNTYYIRQLVKANNAHDQTITAQADKISCLESVIMRRSPQHSLTP